jgi:hypothetical protein
VHEHAEDHAQDTQADETQTLELEDPVDRPIGRVAGEVEAAAQPGQEGGGRRGPPELGDPAAENGGATRILLGAGTPIDRLDRLQ